MNSGVIIVEGNIGAGKMNFARHLASVLDGEYLPEPVDGTNHIWQTTTEILRDGLLRCRCSCSRCGIERKNTHRAR